MIKFWQRLKAFKRNVVQSDEDIEVKTLQKIIKTTEELMEVADETTISWLPTQLLRDGYDKAKRATEFPQPLAIKYTHLDRDKMREEVADVIIVTLGIGTLWFDDLDDLMTELNRKMDINEERIRTGQR